ncbi:MAG: cryptochrome/photolyase family protein [Clostridia bacterium]|nr:cryptochrome/photolyase family protein [Clostridia bacterium]NCC76017.1 cryptochrome/photolyase family protein [Clostridia bacterium]
MKGWLILAKAIWILNDQCSVTNSSLAAWQDGDLVLMAESKKELDLPFAHQKKTAFILGVNRTFAQTLTREGKPVVYLDFRQSQPDWTQIEQLTRLTLDRQLTEVWLMRPKSWSQRQELELLANSGGFQFTFTRDTNLISDEAVMQPWFAAKSFRMETFYQKMRRQTGLLMDISGQPVGGQFNFDKANQQALKQAPAKHPRLSFKKSPLLLEVLQEVQRYFPHQLGSCDSFYFSLTSEQARRELDHFVAHILPTFGQYQDNLILGDPYVSHSLLSAYINVGLLDPMEVCQAAELAYFRNQASIETVEGFIRQILGWREYMFYKYLTLMPGLESANHLHAHRPLPAFYWTGQTHMRCLAQAITDTLEHAYSHHIQRLMITANFATLAQINPHQVHQWYLGVYADAWDWVEIPNTIGMGLFADGGKIASKPYVSSAAYLRKMSNACRTCPYDPKALAGANACPFNALYWHFIATHQATLQHNTRMAMIVQSYRKFAPEKQAAIAGQAKAIFARLDAGQL